MISTRMFFYTFIMKFFASFLPTFPANIGQEPAYAEFVNSVNANITIIFFIIINKLS